MTDDRAAAKRAAGRRAVAMLTDDETVGLGTGSTTAAAIRALGDRVADGMAVTAVTTSHQSRRLAREQAIPLTDLGSTARVATAIDGADQATPAGNLIKGGGAAHAREKILAHAADRLLVVVDDSKLADQLSHPVPVELLPDAEAVVRRRIETLGGDPQLRAAAQKDGPVVTDNGNLVIDAAFGPIENPSQLADRLAATPGVVEHGLFLDAADCLVVGRDNDPPTATVRDC